MRDRDRQTESAFLLCPALFKNTPKRLALPPSAKPDLFQNTPFKNTILQKCGSLQLSIPGHSSAPGISQESVCTGLSPSHSISLSPAELPLLQPSAHQYICVLARLVPHSITSSATVFCVGRALRMFPVDLQASKHTDL